MNRIGAGATRGAKHSRNRAANAAEYALPSGILSVKRLVNANVTDPGTARINSLHFHHNGELLMVGGEDKGLKFFKVDGERNEKQLSVKLKDMRISEARFLGTSSNAVLAGRKPYYYTYDTSHGRLNKIMAPNPKETKSLEHMVSSPQGAYLAFRGAAGYLHVCDASRHQWSHKMKMNTPVRSMTFLDEMHLASSGLDADIYIWDLRKAGRCVARFHHDDGSCTSSLSCFAPPAGASGDSGYSGYQLSQAFLAVGTESGVVSLYGEEPDVVTGRCEFTKWDYNPRDSSEAMGDETAAVQFPGSVRRPIKTIFNLTTKITSTVFHPSGQLLAMASDEVNHLFISLFLFYVLKCFCSCANALCYRSATS